MTLIRYPMYLSDRIRQRDRFGNPMSSHGVEQWLRDRYDAELRYILDGEAHQIYLHIEFPNERAALDFVLRYG